MRHRTQLAVLAGAAALLAGCGGTSGGPAPAPASTETAQRPARVPQGWTRELNRDHGFSIALPPGWKPAPGRAVVLYRSPDRLVALSLSVDRTEEAFTSPPAEFARQALSALRGYRGPLLPGPPRRVAGTPLNGIAIDSAGVTSVGVHEDLELAVLRRDHLVNYTAVIAANTKAPPTEPALARRVLTTVRDLPIG